MRPLRRRVAPLLPAAALVVVAAGPASAARPAPAVVRADPAALPVVVQRLADDAPCRPASTVRAERSPWTQEMLGLDRVWRLTRGEGVPVAVVGTGVGVTVPALRGRVLPVGPGGGQDCVGHGSFVAGLVAAAPDGAAGFTGVAPAARVLAVRATAPRGAVDGPGLARGIRAALDAGARIVAVPVALEKRDAQLTAAVREAVRRDALVVAPAVPDQPPRHAAGEEKAPRDYWPAAEPGVLSVIDFGADGTRPENAPTPRNADLAAPGDRVVSVGPGGDGAFTGSGSSLAVGFVAGAAALVRGYAPELSAPRVRERLLGSAYTSAVPRLDPYAAVSGVLPWSAGPTALRAQEPVVLPVPVSDGGARARAELIAVAGLAVALLVAALGALLPRARARGWRAG
ncbi:S8 family serine peptidase [Streptomyces sp. NPDC058955]|uniref:S8 family serine peptidase n=1 Tax=unclassified Streptomyces TaxID=2593676 RepID=UPI00365CCA00